MKIIVTTSNNYHHIIPIFCHLFNKYWGGKVELVGYDHPGHGVPGFELPANFTFHSMGKQGTKKDFSTDLRNYFRHQDDLFIWMMEDTFLKAPIDKLKLLNLFTLATIDPTIGRLNLSAETMKQDHEFSGQFGPDMVYENTQTAKYRLSTQPSIWRKDFLMLYMRPGLSPWDFETQISINDGWRIIGIDKPAIKHNEGVRRFDIRKYDLAGIDEDVISEMKNLKYL